MNSEDTEAATLIRLLSVPGILALALLGIVVLATSRLLGADTIVREMITEVIAGFGNAILILAVFGLFFRSGLERLIRRAPGGDTIASKFRSMGRSWIGLTQTFGPWLMKVSPPSGVR
jgi:hypothetical protein